MTSLPLNEKAIRLVQYINELSQLKQKPISNYKKYDEVLWVAQLPEGQESLNAFHGNLDGWLSLKKPTAPRLPSVPKEIQDWLHIDGTTFSVPETIIINSYENEDGELIKEQAVLSELPHIQHRVNEFKEQHWIPYSIEVTRVAAIQMLYDKLFKMHQDLQLHSESIELIVSTGLLQWKNEAKRMVKRHLLTSEVELQFNSEQKEFIIVPTTKGKYFRIEEDMLQAQYHLTRADNQAIQALLEDQDNDEQLITNMNSILNKIAHAFDSKVTYTDTFDIPKAPTNGPMISLSPAFILRKKTRNSFQRACESAISQLQDMTEESALPSNLANMFISSPVKDNAAFTEAQAFYFPLPSNEEQNKIITTLNNQHSVLVQGPPGTGKTHTIANLTAHLLATGKSVLITSQTAKALSVLKSKLPTELQDLSVSLLGGDSTAIKDLEKVIASISTNKEQFDLAEMASVVTKKEIILKELKQKLANAKTAVFETREAETKEYTINSTYRGTAQQIAEKVNFDKITYDWYISPVTSDTPATFWQMEKKLISEYLTLKKIDFNAPDGYEQHEYPKLPPTFNLPHITKLIKEEETLRSSYELTKTHQVDDLLQILKSIDKKDRSNLKTTLQEYDELLHSLLLTSYPALKQVLQDIFSNKAFLWEEITNKLSLHLNILEAYKDKFEEILIVYEEVSIEELKIMAEDLLAHVSSGGNMGNFLIKPMIVRQYKATLQKVKCNGLLITSNDQIESLHAYVQTKYAEEQIEMLLSPTFFAKEPINPITAYSQYRNAFSQLTKVLQVQEWREKTLKTYSFISPDAFSEEMAFALIKNIEITETLNEFADKKYNLKQLLSLLETHVSVQSHPLYRDLFSAIKNRDIESLELAYTQYDYFQKVLQHDNKSNKIFSSILEVSFSLATTIETTYALPFWEQRLQIWENAFEWKQARNWIHGFSMKDEGKLSGEFEGIEHEINRTITEIGATKAWISMLSKMTDTQNKHLRAWSIAVKNVGKGTGKNAAKYREVAQKHMEQCIDAIPAWIMPLNQIFENFEIQPNLFDVIIIDEASQSWHDALLLKYMAKKLIIVGDDKQISPTIIGINDEDIAQLQNKFFGDFDFPFGKDLNLKNSLFDIAYIMVKDTITLREHFRCMPKIIGFSNRIAYSNSPLIPLRQYPMNRLEPIVSKYVPHGVREGPTQNPYNNLEADAIVEEIRMCIADERYGGKTFGVISLLGGNQAKLIQSKLVDTIGAELMEERKIICGDAHAFQGDERDVIFLSMVVATGETRLTAVTSDTARQRFNVATSRAKDQLWVMHSISINEIPNKDCLRYQLLSYIADPLKEVTEMNREKCESRFEEEVFDAILARGFRVISQYNVANYKIDLVIQGQKSKLAVECDGDRWHTSVGDRERNFLSERKLQRAGWTFWRVLGSKYYNNPEKALEGLWNKIKEIGIEPYAEWADSETTSTLLKNIETLTLPKGTIITDKQYAKVGK